MNEANITKDDFYVPILEELHKLGGSGSIEELENALIERFGFTQDQLDETYPVSGDNILTDKMSWARSYLKLPGFITNESRGVWVLTQAGQEAMALPFAEICKHIRVAKKAKAAEKAALAAEVVVDSDDEDEVAGGPIDWKDALLAEMKSMSPSAFERLAKRLLRENNFIRVEVTGKSGDGGIDGSGILRLNLISFQVLFQCKRYSGSVPVSTVRDFRGAMTGRADKGLIITTGTFTQDAKREASRDGAPAIDLIDGDLLCELLKDKELGVRVRPVVTEEVTVLPEFFAEI